MELAQLRYLCLLDEERHFTRAAARANVAQPALSRQIRKLEEELGIPLVVRTTRRVAFTPQGSEVVQHARRALEAVEDVRSAAQQVRALQSGRVAIGVTHTPGPVAIAAVLGGFQRDHPNVDLEVREGFSVDLVQWLRSDVIDLAVLTAVPLAMRAGLELRSLAVEPLRLVVGADHPLAERSRVRVAELQGLPLITFPPDATIRRSFEDAAATVGFAPHVACETTSAVRVRELVSQGLGVSVLPASETARLDPSLRALALVGPTIHHEVSVAWRGGRRQSPPAAALLATFTDREG